MVKETVCQ